MAKEVLFTILRTTWIRREPWIPWIRWVPWMHWIPWDALVTLAARDVLIHMSHGGHALPNTQAGSRRYVGCFLRETSLRIAY